CLGLEYTGEPVQIEHRIHGQELAQDRADGGEGDWRDHAFGTELKKPQPARAEACERILWRDGRQRVAREVGTELDIDIVAESVLPDRRAMRPEDGLAISLDPAGFAVFVSRLEADMLGIKLDAGAHLIAHREPGRERET